MNRIELVAAIAEKALKAFSDAVAEELKNGG